MDTLQPITLTGSDNQVLGPTAVLGEVYIDEPAEPPTFEPQFYLDLAIPHTGLQLIGYNQDREVAQPGEAMSVSIFVERISETAVDPLTLTLENENGVVQQSWDISILPSDRWEVGHRYRGQRVLNLPGGLETGVYQFKLQGTVVLGDIVIDAPERLFEQPDFETAVAVEFNQVETNSPDLPLANLTGVTLSLNDNTLTAQLVWQAISETETSYRVFIHLVDGTGQIMAQSDGEPANWSRPTTSWAADEYIIDEHEIQLPEDQLADEWELRIGLYNPENGQRLFTNNQDFHSISINTLTQP